MKNKSVLKALVKLYKEGLSYVSADIIDDICSNCLSEGAGRSGRNTLWYSDDLQEAVIYVDTLEFLTKEDIEKEFC